MTTRVPGAGRYAHLEREQRWLLADVPVGASPVARIRDRYIAGTRVRLRRSESEVGTDFKLGQKVRAESGDPERVRITNIYLSQEEHTVMCALPAAVLDKSRWRVIHEGRAISVDSFEGRLSGLTLAEAELGADDAHLALPAFALVDVTHDDRFSGGSLAFESDEVIAVLLAEVSGLVAGHGRPATPSL